MAYESYAALSGHDGVSLQDELLRPSDSAAPDPPGDAPADLQPVPTPAGSGCRRASARDRHRFRAEPAFVPARCHRSDRARSVAKTVAEDTRGEERSSLSAR